MHRLRNNLVLRSTLLIVGIAFAMAFFMATYLSLHSVRDEYARMSEAVRQGASLAEPMLRAACERGDKQLMQALVDGAISHDLVLSATITYEGAQLASAQRGARRSENTRGVLLDGEVSPVLRSVVAGNEGAMHQCDLRLTPDVTVVRDVISAKSRDLIVLMSLRLGVLALLAAVVIYYLITRPLGRIARSTQEALQRLAALHVMDAPVPAPRIELPHGHEHDAMGALARDINELLDMHMAASMRERDLGNRLETAEKLHRVVFDHAQSGLFVMDRTARLLSINRWFRQHFEIEARMDPAEWIIRFPAVSLSGGRSMTDCIEQSLRERAPVQVEFVFRGKAGDAERWYALVLNPADEELLQGVVNEITEQKRREREMAALREVDLLTGVSNRTAFEADVKRRLASSLEYDAGRFALLLIDIAHFTRINEQHGRQVGDRVLAETAQRLRNALRTGDFVARMAKDEFAVVLDGVASVEVAVRLGREVTQQLVRPLMLPDGVELPIDVSVGFAVRRQDDRQSTDLLTKADRALREARNAGINEPVGG